MHIGNQQLHFEQVASTNDIAWQHAGDDKHDGLLVVAEEQLQGRGRRGDVWLSPPWSALYLSMLLHPDLKCRRPVMLTIWAGVGVCRVIEKTLSIKPFLKWPNDVLIQGKKVCGILVEQRKEWCVVGVGLNVSVPLQHFQAEGVHQASSLSDFTQLPLNRLELLSALQTEWNRLYILLTDQNEVVLEYWRKYSGLMGRSVRLEANGKPFSGRVLSINWDEITIESDNRLIGLQPESITKMQLL